MTQYTAYWVATCLRGVIALISGVVIAFSSGLDATILLQPVGIVFSLLTLSAYVVLDSAIVVASSFMLPHHHVGRVALRLQGFVGMIIGIGCFIVSEYKAGIWWFLYLAALQACCVAIAEFQAARVTAGHHNSTWCYGAAAISALSCAVLIIFHRATGHFLSWLLYSYLFCFGLDLFVLSCHMLFEELRASQSHPAGL